MVGGRRAESDRIARYRAALEFAERQVAALVDRHPDYFPIYTTQGRWHHGGELWTDWTGGFLAGMMWQFHRRTGSATWRERAEHYSQLLEHRKQRHRTCTIWASCSSTPTCRGTS